MSRYYNFGYKPKAKRKDPATQLAKMRKKDPDISPIVIEGRKIAQTWWGMAWNKNLESYADYSNRIGRGRSYVINGAVIDLRITPGAATALVQGSQSAPYRIDIKIDPLSQKTWAAITKKCSHKLSSVEELVSGKFPEEFAEMFTSKGDGLFPSPKEIHFNCSCPDWASMCKHVAASLYGIGARFDQDPTLFFLLRNIDFKELLKKSVDEKMRNMLKNANKVTTRVITDIDTQVLFGV